jgi:nitrate reductase gamma subunit
MKRVAQVTSGSDYFALILILAVVLTGDALRYMSHFDVLQMREYFTGLLAFSYKGLPENNWFLVHYLLALILIIYIPFSKILHLGGIFFTQAVIHKH